MIGIIDITMANSILIISAVVIPDHLTRNVFRAICFTITQNGAVFLQVIKLPTWRWWSSSLMLFVKLRWWWWLCWWCLQFSRQGKQIDFVTQNLMVYFLRNAHHHQTPHWSGLQRQERQKTAALFGPRWSQFNCGVLAEQGGLLGNQIGRIQTQQTWLLHQSLSGLCDAYFIEEWQWILILLFSSVKGLKSRRSFIVFVFVMAFVFLVVLKTLKKLSSKRVQPAPVNWRNIPLSKKPSQRFPQPYP